MYRLANSKFWIYSADEKIRNELHMTIVGACIILFTSAWLIGVN